MPRRRVADELIVGKHVMPARLRAKAPIVDEEHEVGALPVTALEQLHVAFVW